MGDRTTSCYDLFFSPPAPFFAGQNDRHTFTKEKERNEIKLSNMALHKYVGSGNLNDQLVFFFFLQLPKEFYPYPLSRNKMNVLAIIQFQQYYTTQNERLPD